MFGAGFDIFIAVICSGLAVVFMLGKGGKILELFGSGSQPKKKRSPEQERKYQRGIAVFLIPLAIVEIISIIRPGATMGIVLVVVTIVDLIVYVNVIRKKTGD